MHTGFKEQNWEYLKYNGIMGYLLFFKNYLGGSNFWEKCDII